MQLRVAAWPTLTASVVMLLAACGGQAAEVASSTASPSSSSSSSSSSEATASPSPSTSSATPTPTPTGALFVDVAATELEKFAALIGESVASASLGDTLPLFEEGTPLPAGTITGAGMTVEQWQGRVDEQQVVGLDTTLGKADLEAFGAGVPQDWKFNSISTSDYSATLVATRSDGLRLEVASYTKPAKGEPATEVRLASSLDAVPEPAWLATLPALEGGEIAAIGEGVGEVRIDSFLAGAGLVTVHWRYEGDRLTEIQDYLMSGALEVAGFTLVDPDAIRIDASSFDVTAGDWTGQVVVGVTQFDGDTLTDLVWMLQKG